MLNARRKYYGGWKAFKAFFKRIKRGKPGYPRFRSASRYHSITFPTYGAGAKLLDGVGQIKLKRHRPIEGAIKTVTVKREAGKWYAVFSAKRGLKPLPPMTEKTGLDLVLARVRRESPKKVGNLSIPRVTPLSRNVRMDNIFYGLFVCLRHTLSRLITNPRARTMLRSSSEFH